MVSSERFSVSLLEVEREWSIDDLMDANDILDAFDLAEHKADILAGAKG